MAAAPSAPREAEWTLVPGLVAHQRFRLTAARAETAAGIAADDGAGPPPERLGQPADVGHDRRVRRIERRGAGEQGGALADRTAVHPVERIVAAEDHDQRAAGCDRGLERVGP